MSAHPKRNWPLVEGSARTGVFGLDDGRAPSANRPRSDASRHQKQAAGWSQLGAFSSRALEHAELIAQSLVLELKRRARTEP